MVVTDIDQTRLDRAAEIYPVEFAKSKGIELIYLNTGKLETPVQSMKDLTGGKGYDDVFVFAPVPPVIEQGDAILGFDGCLNFFAGPSDPTLSAKMNFYNVHYAYTHIVGTSGGNTNDMKESLAIMSKGLDPAGLITHIGGLNAAADITLKLPGNTAAKTHLHAYRNAAYPFPALLN